jgi:hypothetical protein
MGSIAELVKIAGSDSLFVGPTEALVTSQSTVWVLDPAASTVIMVRGDWSIDTHQFGRVARP